MREDKEGSSSGRVAVFVRCRPLQSQDLLRQQFAATRTLHSHKCVRVAPHSNDQKIVVQGSNKEFAFDKIYDEDSSQAVVFESTVEPLLDGCFEGFNLTILAYGQTGSGK